MARVTITAAVLVLATACVSTEPERTVLIPIRTSPKPPPTVATSGAPDPFADEREPDDEWPEAKNKAPGQLDPTVVAAGTGVDVSNAKMPATPEAPESPEAPATVPAVLALPTLPFALPASWGVRLVSTLSETQPPRAVIGLADGTERVVSPGTMIPEAGVVVLAVGRDAVHIASVKPEGDHANVEASVLTALYPDHAMIPR